MTRKKPPPIGPISMSDRDVLRLGSKSRADATAPVGDDRPPPRSHIPPLGGTPESIIAFMNAITLACLDGELDEKKGDTLTAMARTALNAVKHRDAKQEDRELEELVRRAEEVNDAGEKHEAADRHHVSKAIDPEADADEDDGDD
jgi:hypothetical protein